MKHEELLKLKRTIIKARKAHKLNQAKFWKRLGCTQSAGSRYESAKNDPRNIPQPVVLLFNLVYGPKPLAKLAKLREVSVDALQSA